MNNQPEPAPLNLSKISPISVVAIDKDENESRVEKEEEREAKNRGERMMRSKKKIDRSFSFKVMKGSCCFTKENPNNPFFFSS